MQTNFQTLAPPDLVKGRIAADPEDLERIVAHIGIGLTGDRGNRNTGCFFQDKELPIGRLERQENAVVIHHVGQAPLWLEEHIANKAFSVLELNFDGDFLLGDLFGGIEH